MARDGGGLGLVIVQRILQLHQSEIRLVDREAPGALFQLICRPRASGGRARAGMRRGIHWLLQACLTPGARAPESIHVQAKSILLLCALGGAYLWFQLSNLHIAIGERATGGYDGASTRSPEDVDRAVREAEEAAAKAQAARPEAQRGNQAGPVRPGRARPGHASRSPPPG